MLGQSNINLLTLKFNKVFQKIFCKNCEKNYQKVIFQTKRKIFKIRKFFVSIRNEITTNILKFYSNHSHYQIYFFKFTFFENKKSPWQQISDLSTRTRPSECRRSWWAHGLIGGTVRDPEGPAVPVLLECLLEHSVRDLMVEEGRWRWRRRSDRLTGSTLTSKMEPMMRPLELLGHLQALLVRKELLVFFVANFNIILKHNNFLF